MASRGAPVLAHPRLLISTPRQLLLADRVDGAFEAFAVGVAVPVRAFLDDARQDFLRRIVRVFGCSGHTARQNCYDLGEAIEQPHPEFQIFPNDLPRTGSVGLRHNVNSFVG